MSPRRKNNGDTSGLDALDAIALRQQEDEEISAPRRGKKLRAGLGFIILSILTGALVAGAVSPAVLPVAGATQLSTKYWADLPTTLPDVPLPQRSRILDVNGNPIAEFYSENRVTVPLSDISPFVTKALIATEDSKFYQHNGVDFKGVVRAGLRTAQGDTQGASTITQQLVKNTLVVNAANPEEAAAATDQNAFRKIQEMKYAIELEKKYTKDEILNQYLNIVFLSNNTYGIYSASYFYFNKHPKDLTLTEAALLIGMLKNPSGYNPITHPEEAKERRNIVIDRMQTVGDITAQEATAAKAEEIVLNVTRPANGCAASPYPYYCQWVINTILADPAFGATEEERQATYYRGGLTIKTPLDPRVQDAAQKSVDDALGRGNRVASGVAVIVPGTGQVAAIAQNRTFGDPSEDTPDNLHSQIIYPVTPSFQSGSTFKLFTLATALEAGFPLDSTINAPGAYTNPNFNTPKGGIQNASGVDAGTLTLAQGTARSSNTFYAVLQEKVGVLSVADMAESLGIPVPRTGPHAVTAKDASFTLGTINVSPLQMANAYATFAAGGKYCNPVNMISVTNARGEEIPKPEPNCRQAVSAQTAANVTNILTAVVDSDDPYRTGKGMSLGRPVAGKTGTTNSSAAVWFAGYTPQYATAVWSGDPRGGSKYPLNTGVRLYGKTVSGVAGATVSGPIWKQTMSDVIAPLPVQGFAPSSGNGTSYTVPDVRGMDVASAVRSLRGAGYTVSLDPNLSAPTDFSVPNTVSGMNPAQGTRLFASTRNITLTLSAGSSLNWDLS